MFAGSVNCLVRVLTRRISNVAVLSCILSAHTASAQTVPTQTGKIAWTSAEREDVPLTEVARIAVDAKQRVFVAESKENSIYVYDANGAWLKRFARKGAGPGEFTGPCCIAFDPKGRLWVQDLEGARFVVFSIADSGKSVSTKGAFTVRLPHTESNFTLPLGFDASGNVTSAGHVPNPDDPAARLVKRYVVDSTGKVLRSVVEAEQTENITPPFLHPVAGTSVTYFLYQPYGASALRADGLNGSYAIAGSGKYSVRWYSPSGTPIAILTREVAGPALSRRERLRGDSLMEKVAKRAQTRVSGLPFSLPDRKPPLVALFIDTDGRLWVHHATVDGAPNEADVYNTNGTLSFRAVWPANVTLGSAGYIRGNSAWGFAKDDDDIPHIVRLDFTAK